MSELKPGTIIELFCSYPSQHFTGNRHHRLEAWCRLTCDERLQSVALQNTIPASLSPSSVDAHELSQKSNSEGSRADKSNSTQHFAARPRRLPTLIKILTGFSDEQYDTLGNDNNPIIARGDRGRTYFEAEAIQRRGSTSMKPLSREETVQMAAVAAAAVIWSKSLRIFGNRMHIVDWEWDVALRWIAGWDQHHQMLSPAVPNEFSSVRSNNLVSREGFTTFVDDLASMLESCISKCTDDQNFNDLTWNEEDQSSIAVATSVGGKYLRSFIQWVAGCSLSKSYMQNFEGQGTFILMKTFQLITSSVVAYYIFYSLNRALQVVFHWYFYFKDTESPEWLLEHEKEIQMAKSSRSRQRKKTRRRELTKQNIGGSKLTPLDSESMEEKTNSQVVTSENDLALKLKVLGNSLPAVKIGCRQNKKDSVDPAPFSCSLSSSPGSSSNEDIPTIISCPSTPATSDISPTPFNPINSQLDDSKDITFTSPLQEVSQQLVFGHIANLGHQGPLVPTQEQRNKAAKQLREFQNAQIQRLLHQRQMAQHSYDNCLIPNLTDLHFLGNSVSTLSLDKVLKSPPGLFHPSDSFTQCNSYLHNHDDKGFLSVNEIFLSKLLDDEEDDVKVEAPLSPQIGTCLVPPDSSLDPSAAPFISLNAGSANIASKENGDAWQSSLGKASINNNSPTRMIKGVYGGSVW